MARPEANLRLFVAVYPPLEGARAMLRSLRLLELPDHRATPAEQVHLTLQFIGDTPVADMDRVRESVSRSASGIASFDLQPMRLITLPRRGRPRLVAMETNAPAPMLEMQRRLAHRLARSARERAGDRFTPHLTLCRFSPGEAANDVDHPVELPPFRVESIVLMRSHLARDGARHQEVDRFELEAT